MGLFGKKNNNKNKEVKKGLIRGGALFTAIASLFGVGCKTLPEAKDEGGVKNKIETDKDYNDNIADEIITEGVIDETTKTNFLDMNLNVPEHYKNGAEPSYNNSIVEETIEEEISTENIEEEELSTDDIEASMEYETIEETTESAKQAPTQSYETVTKEHYTYNPVENGGVKTQREENGGGVIDAEAVESVIQEQIKKEQESIKKEQEVDVVEPEIVVESSTEETVEETTVSKKDNLHETYNPLENGGVDVDRKENGGLVIDGVAVEKDIQEEIKKEQESTSQSSDIVEPEIVIETTAQKEVEDTTEIQENNSPSASIGKPEEVVSTTAASTESKVEETTEQESEEVIVEVEDYEWDFRDFGDLDTESSYIYSNEEPSKDDDGFER